MLSGGTRRPGETAEPLHTFKLVDALLGVPGADLAQGLVLVAPGADVLRMDHVVHRLLGLVAGHRQLRAQCLQEQTSVSREIWQSHEKHSPVGGSNQF